MTVLVDLALTLVSLCAPQGGDAAAPAAQAPLLTPAEQKSLHDKLVKLVELRIEYDASTGKERERASKQYEKAREAFDKEWDQRAEKKGNLLRSTADTAAIFDNCFTFERKTATPIKLETPKDGTPYCIAVPKAYKADAPSRAVVVIPGAGDAVGTWVDGREWFAKTWDKSAAAGDTIFHVNQVSKGVDFDTMPDFSREGDDVTELTRIGEALKSFGETNRGYNLDRKRVFLDCGKGSCGFALRFAANFPDRFAGLILRHPTEVDGLRLGSLTGVPVLLIADGTTAAAATKLQKALNDLEKDACKILTATDAYPFKGATPEIETWMSGGQAQPDAEQGRARAQRRPVPSRLLGVDRPDGRDPVGATRPAAAARSRCRSRRQSDHRQMRRHRDVRAAVVRCPARSGQGIHDRRQ
ncbi:MAG: hypothetical protein IPK26_29295 [Planctomycetes bacterium]|nr:hypothetical protein [Planctomycetota bacterium]